LSSQYDRLGPLFSNTNNPNYRLAAASAMSSWMALGKWAVETIDPRNVADPDTSTAALRAVTEFTDIAVDELDFESQDERIGEVMAVAAYRMAGGMAYAGLAKCIKGMREKYVEGNDSPPPVEAIT